MRKFENRLTRGDALSYELEVERGGEDKVFRRVVLGGTSWEQRERVGKFRSFSGCEKSPSTES
jgi:hypothetical protein